MGLFSRRCVTLVAAAVGSMVFAASAAADEVSFAGFTNGCFGAGCTPGTTSGAPAVSLLGLTFTSSTWNGASAGGVLAIGNASGSPNVDNLGSFTLTGTPANYNGQSFTLRTTFTAPPGITGGNSRTFTASLTGRVASNDVGGAIVNFNNDPITFTFSFVNAQGMTVTGSFSFSVNDTAVIAGGTVPLTGQVTGAQQSTAPTGVTLHSLTVSRVDHGVVVRWRTATESGIRGFNLYRQRGGKPVKVNRVLIPSAARGTGRREYSFFVRGAPQRTAVFRLQAVTLTGARRWLGTVAVR